MSEMPGGSGDTGGSGGTGGTDSPFGPEAVDGYASFHDADTGDEVDAAFRSQRRIAIGYFVVFLVALLGLTVVTVTSDWASTGRLLGGFSPSFLLTAIGLYLFFIAIAIAAATLADSVEKRMLGAPGLPRPERDSQP